MWPNLVIIGIGNPSVATEANGDTWLYFVIERWRLALPQPSSAVIMAEAGFSADVARVRARCASRCTPGYEDPARLGKRPWIMVPMAYALT